MAAFRWGIVGPGNIARAFSEGLRASEGAALVAVAGRDHGRALDFARAHGALRAHASVEELLADPEVDAVYVATPHPFHLAPTLAACAAKKPVLVEKPLTPNAADTARAIEAARDNRVFLMEAFWTRFLPAVRQALRWVAEGRIGEPRLIEASFGFRMGWHPESRLLDPAQAGGGLLDVGVYPVALCDWVFGQEPQVVKAVAHLGVTGVDEQAAVTLKYPAGQLGLLSCAVRTTTWHVANIFGTEGSVTLHFPWWKSTCATLRGKDCQERVELSFRGNGYEYEADEVARRVQAGELESPWVSWESSLRIARTLDRARAEIGLVYPFERGR